MNRRCGRVCLRQIRTHSSHRGKEAITPYPAKRMCRGYFLIPQTPMRARKGIGLLVLPDTPIARLPEPSEVPVSSFESWIYRQVRFGCGDLSIRVNVGRSRRSEPPVISRTLWLNRVSWIDRHGRLSTLALLEARFRSWEKRQ